MRSSTILIAATTVLSAVASPVLVKKANYDAPPGGDIDILNYALTLEYLERKFYQEGLAKFTVDDFCKAGFNAEFYANLKEIYVDEQVWASAPPPPPRQSCSGSDASSRHMSRSLLPLSA